jgi:hypothetical protein
LETYCFVETNLYGRKRITIQRNATTEGYKAIYKGDTKLDSILEELHLLKFNGICIISRGPLIGSIVYKSGKCILAEFQNFRGDAAWDELQKIIGENVEIVVSTMDDTQIELSLEFNRSARIERTQTEKVKKASRELLNATGNRVVSEEGSETKKIQNKIFI